MYSKTTLYNLEVCVFSFVENCVINLNMGLLESTYLRGVPVIVNNG